MISIEQVIPLLLEYKYWAVFPAAFLEGPIITVIVGFFSSLGVFNIVISYVIIVAGDLASDLMFFWIGERGGVKFIEKWGKYFGLSPKSTLPLEKHFGQHGGKMLFLGKLSHGIGAAFLVAAGLAKMNFARFMFYNSVATLIKSLILIIIGFYFGQAFASLDNILDRIAFVTLVSGIALALFSVFYLKKKSQKTERP